MALGVLLWFTAVGSSCFDLHSASPPWACCSSPGVPCPLGSASHCIPPWQAPKLGLVPGQHPWGPALCLWVRKGLFLPLQGIFACSSSAC